MTVDCDILQGDGGKRTASVTGVYVALVIAIRKMIAEKIASPRAIKTAVAAVSAGIIPRVPSELTATRFTQRMNRVDLFRPRVTRIAGWGVLLSGRVPLILPSFALKNGTLN